MELDYPTIEEAATPEYVLGVLGDIYHQLSSGLPAFSFDTKVDDWDLVMDFDDWRSIAQSMNGFWNIDCPSEEWRKVLLPMETQTMRAVCELIARNAKRPRLRPLMWLGRECLPGAAFLTIRSFLHQAGCSVRNVAPSTPLAGVASCYRMRLVSEVSRLAPRMLPRLRVWTPGTRLAFLSSLLGTVLITIGLGFSGVITVLGALITGAALVHLALATFQVIQPKIDFGGLQTFRDLALAIANEQRSSLTSRTS